MCPTHFEIGRMIKTKLGNMEHLCHFLLKDTCTAEIIVDLPTLVNVNQTHDYSFHSNWDNV